MPSATQRIAQSGFHCSLAWPPVTGVSKRSPVSGSLHAIVPFAAFGSTATCMTMPVFG
jgi:hypothetical protein